MSDAPLEPRGAVYAALSALLDYPGDALVDALPSIDACLRDAKGLTNGARAGLARLVAYLGERDLLTLQENYVALFDRGRATSLHLFEHVHGESRDRGQAMVDLLQMYERHGLYLSAHELPDYLPVFLEYLSRLPERDARNLLEETAEILQALATALAKRGSHYGFAIGALLSLAGKGRADVPESPDDDAHTAVDHRALDADYADEPVRFVGAETPGAAEPVRFYDKRPGR
ncbi:MULTISPECIES: nitrate reductase molybdenum cofactor assembly chaperone [Burkholderia]|uniref:nitrate reductase molybdenum cofactor assembly chaperone n=1 Tax=Burkholderia TaxID=32008 RepID=UPI000530F46E|nr:MULTISPECIES: nitrate reductase molybdenum cofactor assembly chaperone [Burkholderia]AOJ71522.1 nitrate reductase [Burkholderia savannae]AOJ83848.1 nitrate reductase [Burkholderia savannae]AOK49917.1 nitrate reductase [Burkholderia sp. MSMB617WGS]KGS04682.1 nitrate reductase molybdenum cofactor assembly chaperone [Burkholderia sp. ABCPW 111]KVG37084.1 nitrate reductase [Burkholderia sp. MSMB0265]